MSSIVGVRRKGRQRGGRHKAGLPSNANTVKHHIVVDDDFWQMLEVERRPEETNNDALWRIFTERTNRIRDLQKKVDALAMPREELQEVIEQHA
jgi:hypothetical protein